LEHAQGQQHPISVYFTVWGLLFVLGTLSYLVDYLHLHGYLRWSSDPGVHVDEGGADRRRLHAHALGALALMYAILTPSLCLLLLISLMAIEVAA
jgi:cytochrome c oxidase subunit 4